MKGYGQTTHRRGNRGSISTYGDTLLSNHFSLYLDNVVYFYPLKLVEFKALTQACSETCVLTRF